MIHPPRRLLCAAMLTLLAACSSASTPSTEASHSPEEASPIPSSSADGEQINYVAFGDSWPFGAHCNGCRPFPELIADGLAGLTAADIEFTNRVTNGGTAQELAETIATDDAIREDIAAADLIVIAIGGNDLGPAFDAYAAGTCGGADDLDCFRSVRDTLRTAYDSMLTEIDELRDGQPTAVRMVTTSNEFLADEGLIELFGADFGLTEGVEITTMNRDAQCEVAAAHDAICIDLGRVLNGPDLTTPQDVNTQAAMQQVADAVLAAGLAELGGAPAATACEDHEAEPIALEPEEDWIVFQSLTAQFGPERCDDGIDGDDTIFLVRPDGSGLHRLAPDDWVGSEVRPTWSPDGNRVAFLRARLPNDRSELWAIDADGGNPELLYTCVGPNAPDTDCNSLGDPDWSPDGSAIYFARDSNPLPDGPPGTFEIWRHDLATGESGSILTREDEMSVEQPRLSPTGDHVVYVRFRNITSPESDSALFIADLESGDERQLTEWGLMPADPDWSITDRIAFNTFDLRLFPDTTEAVNLYSIASDGSDLRQITDYGADDTRAAQPRWTSDGSSIVYTLVLPSPGDPFGERRLASIAPDGESAGYPISAPIIGTHPEPRPMTRQP